MNNGVVTIESAGETGDSVFENIPDPEHVRTLIFKQMEIDEQSDSHRDAAAIADALEGPGSSRSGTGRLSPLQPRNRLTELEGLHQRGLVSDEEFEVEAASRSSTNSERRSPGLTRRPMTLRPVLRIMPSATFRTWTGVTRPPF